MGAATGRAHAQRVPQALLQGVPPPAGGGIKYNFVISGGMYVENDTSHEIFADNFGRNRGGNFVQPNSKKWHVAFTKRHATFLQSPRPLLSLVITGLFLAFNRPRPNRSCAWPSCRSTRRCRPRSPAPEACTGRRRRPPPSSSVRTPGRRTTWSWQSRPRTA